MTLNKKYKVFLTSTFKEEFKEIIYYIKHRLKEPIIAKKFYKKIIYEIKSLEFMPERSNIIKETYHETIALRKIFIDNYVIIYEVKNDIRTSIYFTYFS